MPIRIQRKRTAGWKMPENTVYVGRPTKWGNPFKGPHAKDAYADMCRQARDDYNDHVAFFCSMDKQPLSPETFFSSRNGKGTIRLDTLHELKGKNLACWCKLSSPCHADVLLELANAKN